MGKEVAVLPFECLACMLSHLEAIRLFLERKFSNDLVVLLSQT